MENIQIRDFLDQLAVPLKKRRKKEDLQKFFFSMLLFRLASFECQSRGDRYVPSDLGWEGLKKRRGEELRRYLYDAMRMLKERDSKYKGLVDPESVFGEVGDEELHIILGIMDQCLPGGGGDDSDLTRLFELAMGHPVFNNPERMEDYGVPRQVSDLIVTLLEPEEGVIYDPCCGSGGMLVSAAGYMKRKNRNFQLYGREVRENAWRIARMNLAVRGIDADLGEAPVDIVRQDVDEELKADYILGNPPFHGYAWDERQANDRRWKYGRPSAKRGDFAWMQHMLYHLREKGRMGAIFSNGILDSLRAEDRKIRAALLEEDLLEAVITLPAGLFYHTKAAASLWILCKTKLEACKDKVFLADVRKFGETSEGKHTVLPDWVQEKLIRAYRDYQNGAGGSQVGFCRQVAATEIEAGHYSLVPENYIIRKQEELPGLEELEARERSLEAGLKELMNENRKTLALIFREE